MTVEANVNRNLQIGTFAPIMGLVMLIAGACSAEGIPTKFTPVNESLDADHCATGPLPCRREFRRLDANIC
jgi:hypothetical protein